MSTTTEDELTVALESIKTDVNDSIKKTDASNKDLTEKVEASETVIAEMKAKNDELITKVDTLETTLKDLPDTTVEKVDNSLPILKFVEEDEVDGKVKSANISISTTKAYLPNQSIAGSPTQALQPYFNALEGNPFRMLGTVFPTMAGTISIPKVSGIAFAVEDNQPANGRSAGGNLASENLLLKGYTSENSYSLTSLNEVMNLDGVVTNLMNQAAGKADATQSVAGLNAGSYSSVNTGVAARLPTKENIIGKMADLVASLGTAYLPMARFCVSRELYSVITQSDNNGLAFDPANGVSSLFGYPLEVSGYLQAGNTANHKSAYFGDFGKGLLIATSENLMIGRYDQTRPGSLTYYGMFKTASIAWDDKALVSLKTAV